MSRRILTLARPVSVDKRFNLLLLSVFLFPLFSSVTLLSHLTLKLTGDARLWPRTRNTEGLWPATGLLRIATDGRISRVLERI